MGIKIVVSLANSCDNELAQHSKHAIAHKIRRGKNGKDIGIN